jgi:putative ABC transport system permease protein
MFGQSDPIGKMVQLNEQSFQVIGVYQTTAGFLKTLDGRGPNRPKVIVPLESARRHLGASARWIMLTVKPRDPNNREGVMDEVTAVMRSNRGLRPSQPNNFALVGQDRLMEVFDQLFGAIFLVGLALSAVGLLVDGVGVVAIMMISVTERTREIGLRKALGARRREILLQFLAEAVALTMVGGVLGIAIGSAIGIAINLATGFPVSLPWWSFALGLGFSATVGILFGMVPAIRAARLDPIEALRYE